MIDWYRLAWPLLGRIDPERAHALAVGLLARGLVPGGPAVDDPVIATEAFGRRLASPIGLAAGFDKDGRALPGLARLGFGFVEVGSVTPRPQGGNPRPRLFRLVEDAGAINRMGFPGEGLDAVAPRLEAARRRGDLVIGANLGRNKETADDADDYATGAARLASHADYVVVNVSSPNTPGLRALQTGVRLAAIVASTRAAMATTPRPLLVKVAPDLDADQRRDVATAALASAVDGLIVGNTTLSRPEGLRGAHRDETGGLSGRPLFALSTAVLADFHRLTEGRLMLIGCGGVASGAEAYAKIRAGARLVQLYTGLVYHGPALAGRVARELAALLRRDGYTRLDAAVGADLR